MTQEPHKITNLLIEWRSGRADAGEELMNLVYMHARAARARKRCGALKKVSLADIDLVHFDPQRAFDLTGSVPASLASTPTIQRASRSSSDPLGARLQSDRPKPFCEA